MPTEKTPLASTSSNFGSAPAIPFYVQDTRRFYSRRRRERQLQCIMFVSIVATFIMALIVTISYSVNHPTVIPSPTNTTNETEEMPPNLLRLSEPSGLNDNNDDPAALSPEEIRLAVIAGNEAIAARKLADTSTKPLPSPSPNSRHQYAVSTSDRADRLAIAGLAEIAATRRIERARAFTGKPTSFGSYLDGGWAPENVCSKYTKIKCPVYGVKYRRFDGSCNHPFHLGMAFTPYTRSLPPDYADGIDAPRVGKFGNSLPSAREVSLKVHPPSPSTNPSFTVMLAVFGQFLDHDVTATAISQGSNGSSLSCCPPSGSHPECFPVKVGPGDPVYDVAGSSCMEFVRSAPAAQCKIGPRQQLNQVTSFIDGSAIYGSDVDTADDLREFSKGRLRMQLTPDKRELLPASVNPKDGCNRQRESARGRYCFATGDARANENLHLTTMHLLWAREHNRLAEGLARVNPHWDDERLYQESRRIVGAQMQHITYREFLPIVLGESEARRRDLVPLPTGFRVRNASDVNPAIANHFAAAAFRFAHTLLPGLMKVTDMQKGTSSYVQLHKMLFNPYSLYAQGGVESSITTTTSNTIQKTSTHVTSQLTEHLFEDPLGNQTVPCGLDLVSLNIQRGRDHGLPGYTKWREYCGLRKPLKFEDLKDDADPEALDAISKLYDNVDDVDLYTGALSELPKGDKLIGPTFTCLIADQFQKLQSADAHWYELSDHPGSFNEDQLTELKKATLARIICDTSAGITEVQPEVMRSVGTDNPMTSCEDIPQVSLEPWKTEIPMLTLSETLISLDDWVNFQLEVNQTINNFISRIVSKKPPAGSSSDDWLAFQKEINKTFTDLRNKFSALHPKTVVNANSTRRLLESSDWMSTKKEVNKTVDEIMVGIKENESTSDGHSENWLALKKKINNTLADIRKEFKVVQPKANITQPANLNLTLNDNATTIDWIELRNNINETIMDIVNSINATNSSANSYTFKNTVIDVLRDLKSKFIGSNNTSTENSNDIDKATFDWVEFREHLNSTLNDIIQSTISKKPPTGSSEAEWLSFQKHINTTFAKFVDQFSEIHSIAVNETTVDTNVSQPLSSQDKKEFDDEFNNVNKTVSNIVAKIQANRPSPGSKQEDWLEFQQKMSDSFADMKNKYAYLYSNKKDRSAKSRNPSVNLTIDMEGFKKKLDESLTDLESLVKTKKPNSTSSKNDWSTYKKQVRSSVNKIKNRFADVKNEILLTNAPGLTLERESFSEWKDKTSKKIDEILSEIKNVSAGNDTRWTNFRGYMDKSLTDLKSNVTTLQLKQPPVKLMAIMWEDWLEFKSRINSTVEDALDDIYSNKPPRGDPYWAIYKIYIKHRFAEMREEIKAIKSEWYEKVRVASEMMTLSKPRLSAASTATSFAITSLAKKYHFGFIFISIMFYIR